MALNYADLAKEAERRQKKSGVNAEPYVYVTRDDKKIEIPFPNSDVYMALSEVPEGKIATQFRILLSSNPVAFREFIEDISELPVTALQVINEDMWSFWNTDITQVPGK